MKKKFTIEVNIEHCRKCKTPMSEDYQARGIEALSLPDRIAPHLCYACADRERRRLGRATVKRLLKGPLRLAAVTMQGASVDGLILQTRTGQVQISAAGSGLYLTPHEGEKA